MRFALALALAPGAALVASLATRLRSGWAREALGRAMLAGEQRKWREFLAGLPPAAPSPGRGRGVVVVGGTGRLSLADGPDYTLEALMAVASLRLVGCRLPVELWHNNDSRLEGQAAAALAAAEGLNVALRNVLAVSGSGSTEGFQLVTFVLMHSTFEEVLLVDSDNVFVSDPSLLFETAAYRDAGAVFWPDWAFLSLTNPFWKIVDREAVPMRCIETGQMMFHRGRHWRSLALAHYFNARGPEGYYLWSWGDTGMFAFAWLATHAPFHMVNTPLGIAGYMSRLANQSTVNAGDVFCGHTMLQFHPADPDKIMFAHRAHSKWSRLNVSSAARWEYLKMGSVVNSSMMMHGPGFHMDRTSDHNKYIFPPVCYCDDGRYNHYCYDYADYRQMPLQPVPSRMASLETELLKIKSELVGAGVNLRADFFSFWVRGLESRGT